ncbi:MAG: DUF4229 domain-containing protein [Streptosporangiaceae bacterium]
MRATLMYTMLRFLLFIVVFVLLYVAGARSFLLLGLAILVSGILSYFLLTGQRTAMSGAIGRRLGGMRGQISTLTRRLDAGASREDDE